MLDNLRLNQQFTTGSVQLYFFFMQNKGVQSVVSCIGSIQFISSVIQQRFWYLPLGFSGQNKLFETDF